MNPGNQNESHPDALLVTHIISEDQETHRFEISCGNRASDDSYCGWVIIPEVIQSKIQSLMQDLDGEIQFDRWEDVWEMNLYYPFGHEPEIQDAIKWQGLAHAVELVVMRQMLSIAQEAPSSYISEATLLERDDMIQQAGRKVDTQDHNRESFSDAVDWLERKVQFGVNDLDIF